jgi:hypothetical protein
MKLFHEGMGGVCYGFEFNPDYSKTMYHYCTPFISQGCIQEAVVLAFEKKIKIIHQERATLP